MSGRLVLRRRLRGVVGALCLTELTSWGVLFYALPVLLPAIVADTGWSAATVTGAFSLGQIVAALGAVPVGRLLDRHGPRPVMSIGSVLAVLAVLGIAWAPDPVWFTLAWVPAGLAMAAVLYEPAFAAVTRWHGPDRVRALTAITLAGGLASTVFAPVTALLAEAYGWRGALLVLAALLAVLTIPPHVLLLRPQWPSTVDSVDQPVPEVGVVVRGRRFLGLMVASTLAAFAVSVSVVHLPPMLVDRGFPVTLAAIVLGVGGAAQVLGRLGYGPLVRASSLRGRTVGIFLALAVTVGLLGAVTGPASLVVLMSVLAGAVRGVFTLLRATAVSDRWGTARYAVLSGMLAAPAAIAGALAPWAGSVLVLVLGGYPALFLLLSGVLLAAAGVAWWSDRSAHRPRSHRLT